MAFMGKGPLPFPGRHGYQSPIKQPTPQQKQPMMLPPGVVHRQFNSPLHLYSTEAVTETLNKQAHVFSNGAVGIDFRYLAAPNLAKSEVLKMLEAEEQTRQGPGLKRVAWPPPPENQVITDPAEAPGNYQAPLYNGTSQRPWENGLSNDYHHREEHSPLHYQQPAKQVFTSRPIISPPPPPPSTVTLRQEAPFYQAPPPVFASQPAVKRQEPVRMRGDQKWPPAHYKEAKQAEIQAAQEAVARARAAGKPKRVRRDYTAFFAQNMLTPTYPGYKAPPGTQHYEEEGTSDL